jgi:hypothetical protein
LAKREMTPEQRQEMREHMATVRAARGAKKPQAADPFDILGGDPTAEPPAPPAPEILEREAPVEGEQVAPATPEAGAHDPSGHEPFASDSVTAAAIGQLAQALAGNPAVDAAFKRAIDQAAHDWEATEPAEQARREHIYYHMRALRELRSSLTRIAQKLERERSRATRLRAI